LGSSQAKSDSVVADFMKSNIEADIVVWVNPISPFQTSQEISEVVNYFIQNNLDSLVTVEDKQVHCNYKDMPVNYDTNKLFAQTQDLSPVQPFVYSIMMWRRDIFLSEYSQKGHALFCGNFGTYSVDKISGIIIKTADDLKMADLLMQSIGLLKTDYSLKYDNLVNNWK
jgi:CMP-N-acetylneuraminic acid synthetase